MLLQHRSIAVRHGRKAAVQLGRKGMPAFDLQPSPFAVRFGCKVVARSRAQIDKTSNLAGTSALGTAEQTTPEEFAGLIAND